MSKVYVDIEAHLGRTTKQKGTITIDRASRTISVKPRFGREDFTLPLEDIAEYIVFKILRSKAFENRMQKKRRARKVSRGLLSTGLR